MPAINTARTKYAEAKAARKARPPKRFTEQGGLEHILELSQQAVSKKEQHFSRLVAQDKASRESVAQRERERAARKEAVRQSDSRIPSRTEIMEQLKERKREKTRARKEARRKRAAPENPETPEPPTSILKSGKGNTRKRKTVSCG